MPHQTHVVKIDPKGKYVFLLKNAVPQAKAEQLANMLTAWLKSDAPFFILDNDTRLVRMDVELNENMNVQ